VHINLRSSVIAVRFKVFREVITDFQMLFSWSLVKILGLVGKALTRGSISKRSVQRMIIFNYHKRRPKAFFVLVDL